MRICVSDYLYAAVHSSAAWVNFDGHSLKGTAILNQERVRIGLVLGLLTACGPHAHIPLRPANLPDALAPTDSGAQLARRLAPVLYLQRDETFPLERVVAVLHPSRRVIAYHLLWRDDIHGAWIPFTVPTDEEVLWVGYDSTYAPTDLWTYWHGQILHTPWPKSQVRIDVQWGKHGNMPRNVVQSDLPKPRTLNFFYAMTIFGEPDILLGDISRKGPLCFCHGYRRYRQFTRPVPLGDKLDAVVRSADPGPVLRGFFGVPYSDKHRWP
ncbi:MAG: hypothetical protein M3Z54_04095 [Gemmatimonadota bacterium]|nr:hypothetical protein [Gemmatimonadota bacterium]